jgi:hypothetical protein
MTALLWIALALLLGVSGHHGHSRNYGGFSWRRFVGISCAKYQIGKAIGVPTTASGRQRKLGRWLGMR